MTIAESQPRCGAPVAPHDRAPDHEGFLAHAAIEAEQAARDHSSSCIKKRSNSSEATGSMNWADDEGFLGYLWATQFEEYGNSKVCPIMVEPLPDYKCTCAARQP